MKKKIIASIPGVLFMLFGAWLGFHVVAALPHDHWAIVPGYSMSLIYWGVGYFMLLNADL